MFEGFVSTYMNPSNPLQIGDATRAYNELVAKRNRNEKLDALERDDFRFLKNFVGGHNREYARLDYDGVFAYELWRDYLADQLTMSGALLNSEILRTLELVVDSRRISTQDELLRLVRRIKRVHSIFRELHNKSEKKQDETDNDFKDFGE